MRNIFVCWSGNRSQRLADALRRYLPSFIPGLVGNAGDRNLFMSADIAKRSRWFDEVERELDKADAGLVCVTREALQSGWIHFEAGALARAVRKNDQARRGTLYTYLLGVQPDELRGPLVSGVPVDAIRTRRHEKALCGNREFNDAGCPGKGDMGEGLR